MPFSKTKPWSERIPTAIADGEKLLDGAEYVLIPPHIGGNKTKLTLVLTAGEVEMAKALWHEMSRAMDRMNGTERATFIAGFRGGTIRYFTEKIEELNHE